MLPPFPPPTLRELREWYRLREQDEAVWRLILEVQHSRELLAHLNWLLTKTMRAAERAEFGRLTGEDAPLRKAVAAIAEEMLRIGPVGGKGKPDFWRPTPRSPDKVKPFEFDPDDPLDRAALIIARGHQRRR